MNISAYFETYQPIAYKVFGQSLKHNRLSHAYLISGSLEAPLLEIALYLAKSLVCEFPNPFADGTCLTCQRIDDRNYVDLIVYNGEEATIKKDDVYKLEKSFSLSSQEKKGKLIYIIHHAENMTPEATNSLLKFLEEPEFEVYAFLTSLNIERLLPTIISRCQLLNIQDVNPELILKAALNEGFSPEDSEILSNFHQDLPSLKKRAEEKDYLTIKNLVVEFFQKFVKNRSEGMLYLHTEIIESLTKKELTRFFIDIYALFLYEVVVYQKGGFISLTSYAKLITALSKLFPSLISVLLDTLRTRNILDLNVNASLLLSHLGYELLKGTHGRKT